VGKPMSKDPVPDMNTLASALTNTASLAAVAHGQSLS
jgi:hypothetical protein